MAYKFQRGPATVSGSFTAEEGLTSNTSVSAVGGNLSGSAQLLVGTSATIGNGLTVTAGNTSVQALTASSIQGGAVSVLSNYVPYYDTVGLKLTSSYLYNNNVGGNEAIKVSASSGITVNFEVAKGALTASSGVRVNAGGVSVAAGGVTIDSGDVTVKSGFVSASNNIQAGSSITASSGIQVSNGGINVLAGDSNVQKLTVNGDLIVLGSTFSASVGTLLIEDKAIVVGDGSTGFDPGYGLLFGSGSNQWASFQTDTYSATNVLSSSLPIKASSFVGSMASTVTEVPDGDFNLNIGVNFSTASLTAIRTWTLPASPSVGESVKIKAPENCGNGPGLYNITIQRNGSQLIDNETFVTLESPWAAIECVYVATNKWSIF